MRCLKLPFHFDPVRLAADFAQVAPDEWIPHVNRHDYEGRWSGAALRSPGGAAGNIIPESSDPSAWRETALLGRCAYFREVIGTLRCPLQAVRLLRLHAGSRIAEHTDQALDFEDGEVRLHVPVATSDRVSFFIDGARLVMAPGECWYTNVNLPHSVLNEGDTDRIHLVIDCHVDDWLRTLFAETPRPAPDNYAAELRAPDVIAAPAWMEFFVATAAALSRVGERVTFRAEGPVLILQWRSVHTWQLRLRVAAGFAVLESSPDADGRHRQDYVEFLARWRAAFPAGTVAEQGLS